MDRLRLISVPLSPEKPIRSQEYVKANVLKDDVYTFTNAVNTVTVDDGDTTTEDLATIRLWPRGGDQ